MKRGAYLINNSRGTVVDLDALARRCATASRWRRHRCVSGRAVVEHGTISQPLQGMANVILTPHIGGSTEEAQERIGAEVAHKLIDYSRQRLDHRRSQFPAGPIAGAPAGHAIYSRSPQRARHAEAVERGVLMRDINIVAQYLETVAISATWCSTPIWPAISATNCSPRSARSKVPSGPGWCMNMRQALFDRAGVCKLSTS